MNIVMMTNTYLPHVGGVARSVASSAAWLRARGHCVLVAAPTFEGSPEVERDVVRVRAIQHFNGSDFSMPLPATAPLHRALERFGPDLVHSHHPFLLGDTALRVAAAFDLPIVFTHHTMYEHFTHYVPLDSPRMKRFAIELATGYADLCDAVFAPSETVAAILRERGVRTRIEVVPTGVDVARFAGGKGPEFRITQGIPADAIVVGHVGRLAAEKNLEFLARAIADHVAADARIHALIVGSGPEQSVIRAHFSERCLGDRLHLPGVLEGQTLAGAYRAMDVFAFSSKTETQGLVLTEAMAAGVPVVALDAPGVREVVRDRVNGRLLRAENLDAFVSALIWATSPDTRKHLEAGVAETAEAYSIDSTGRKALGVYAGLERHDRNRMDRSGRAWDVTRRRLREEWTLLSHRAQTVRHSWPAPKATIPPSQAPIRARLIGRLLAGGLYLLAATWRVEGTDAVRAEMEKWTGTPLLVGFWHGKYFPFYALLRGTRANVFIGEGLRGTLIEAICRVFGFFPVLLPHGDRDRAIERMRTVLAGPLPCATAFDGPVGPPRRVKPSLIQLASDVRATILPLSMSASPRSVLRWRWDLREIPWPFARVKVRVGSPIQVPVGISQDAQAEWSERVKSALDDLDAP